MKTTDTQSTAPDIGVGSGVLLGVFAELATEQRSCADQCIHAPKAKAMYLRRAAEIEAALTPLDNLIEAAKQLREIVEGVRSERWVSDETDGRLKDTTEWCVFYSALAKFKLGSPNK